MAIKGGKPYLAYTPLSHYIFCPVVKVVSTQFPPCVPAEIALISTLTRQVCTYQRLTYLLTLSTYRCADLTVRFAADYTPYCKLKTLRTAFSVPYNNVRRARLHILCVENTPPKNKKQPNKRLPFFGELSAAIFCNSKQPNDRRYQQNRCRSNNNSGEYAAADKVCFLSCAHIFFRDLSLFEKFFQIRGNIIAPAESVCQY